VVVLKAKRRMLERCILAGKKDEREGRSVLKFELDSKVMKLGILWYCCECGCYCC